MGGVPSDEVFDEEEVGVFFVDKPGKRQLRLILDGRIANLFFEEPFGVELAGGASLGGWSWRRTEMDRIAFAGVRE